MNQSASTRSRSPLTTLFTTVALIALVAACGGGSNDANDSSDGGTVSEKQAGEVARQYFLTTMGVLSGKNTPDQLLQLYAPECRAGVDTQSIAATMLLIRAFVPDLDKLKIDDVDLGELKYERNDKGVLVAPSDPSKVRIKVDGKFTNVDDYFKTLGFGDSSSPADTSNEPLLIVKRSGKAYIGDCSGLSDLAIGTSGSSGANGFSGSVMTSPTQSTGPGSSRSSAIKHGDAATVESKWKITVLDVNQDAWAALQAQDNFNDPPAADERFVLVRVGVENVSKDDTPEQISDFDFSLTGSHNQLYSSYDQDHSCFAPDALEAKLYPKGTTQGNLCFRIAKDETGLLLVWDSFSGGQTYFKLD